MLGVYWDQSRKKGRAELVGRGLSATFTLKAKAFRSYGEFSKLSRARLQRSVKMRDF